MAQPIAHMLPTLISSPGFKARVFPGPTWRCQRLQQRSFSRVHKEAKFTWKQSEEQMILL